MTMNPYAKHYNINNRIFVVKNIVGRGTVVGYSYVSHDGGSIKISRDFPVNNQVAIGVIRGLANMAEKIDGITTEELIRLANILESE